VTPEVERARDQSKVFLLAARRCNEFRPLPSTLVHAAARFLRRSVSWVYNKAEDGTLPVTRLGGWGLRFIPGDLRAWVASGAPRRR
jgi:predicted DNA-binding transcriptional regulator AlpA